MTRSFSIIVAADEANGIGRAGDLPWKLPGDMAFFKRTTLEAHAGKRNVVIMGRRTFQSIPPRFRPLSGRENIVISRTGAGSYRDDLGLVPAASLDEALNRAANVDEWDQIFVIGGGELYREALQHPACSTVLLTRVHTRFDCDTFLPPFERAFYKTHSDGPHQDGEVAYTFETYARRAAT